jgi:hypothetical protein
MGMVNQGRRGLLKSGLLVSASTLTFACSGGSDTQIQTAQGNATEPSESSVRTPRQIGALFLSEQEMLTLAALADQLIPEDATSGGAAAGCHEGIQLLLSAFSFDPPMIFAGGPFSNRGGSSTNHFEKFIELDSYDELAWRMRLEGSQGRPEEANTGVIKGWQMIYREGLQALNSESSRYGVSSFQELPIALKALVLNLSQSPEISELIDIAFPHCLQFMYGAPEYGGNKALAGWRSISFQGDVQPKGFTAEQVTKPDNPGLTELLGFLGPISTMTDGSNGGQQSQSDKSSGRIRQAALLPVPALDASLLLNRVVSELVLMASDEFSLAMTVGSESRLSRMRSFIQGKLTPGSKDQGALS